MSNVAKNFDILATSLNVLYNFDSLIKLFSDLYLAKFLNISAKSIFPRVMDVCIFSNNKLSILSMNYYQ